ncbi:MAG: formylglycine-generating enzyme family protein [Candidatus Glassbacteria bacterium]|nr:formylglycine-generating enzyme family protein [Candidatus Glassbacteria bacterium]
MHVKDILVRFVPLLLLLLCACSDEGANVFRIDIVEYQEEGRDIEMASLPGGTFTVGSTLFPHYIIMEGAGPGGSDDLMINNERPVHVVAVSPFLISTTEITHAQYRTVMGTNPSRFSGEIDMPVENVTWFQAADFCNGLSELMRLERCYYQDYTCDYGKNGFRLPTESEWEYAARGGTTAEYSFGSSESGLSRAGWYISNSENKPRTVARKQENPYGLFDMHGNVFEWCQDYFDTYNCGTQTDPTGPDRMGYYKVVRGGSWASQPVELRSAHRGARQPGSATYTVGFRIVRRP